MPRVSSYERAKLSMNQRKYLPQQVMDKSIHSMICTNTLRKREIPHLLVHILKSKSWSCKKPLGLQPGVFHKLLHGYGRHSLPAKI
mmetsp:Transcript_9498/g.16465  ORF Transcript_9498/g.16465 Transcript_9498/m.16465 type:complete len:86 (-) Transcript_9498:1063-1320(-)